MAGVNTMEFNQVSAVLNAIQQQVTGQTEISTITNTADFISVAHTTLQAGYEPILGAISQLIDRTIYSVRPYDRKFAGIYVDNRAYGAHTRKINFVDQDAVDDQGYTVAATDGQSVDQYVIRKPSVVQTNFYGYNTYEDWVTRYEDQLNTAFSGPDQLAEFWSNLLMEISNKHEQWHESMARAAICNFIGAKNVADTSNVIHLLTEYNATAGTTLTATTVYQPANFKTFTQWVYSRIASLCSMMTERSIKFHSNITGKLLERHTPYRDQKIYLLAQDRYQQEKMAISDIYHDNYLRLADVETVNYWQNIDAPDEIKITPSYMRATGDITTAAAAQSLSKVYGVIFDREAIGISTFAESTRATPMNARGRYTNIWWNFQDRYWNDFSENGIVLMMN